jgi:hypothetical protein
MRFFKVSRRSMRSEVRVSCNKEMDNRIKTIRDLAGQTMVLQGELIHKSQFLCQAYSTRECNP